MTTVTDVTTAPASGLNHIDALLDEGPGWNWLAPARNTLRYTFSLAGGPASDLGSAYTGSTSVFNSTQQAAATQALARLSLVTGIHFEVTSDSSAADIHFGNANLLGGSTSGYSSTSWNYIYSGGQVITEYTADAWVYLDNAEFATTNATPTAGSAGFEVLLHELGHTMGLKHPFDGAVRLPSADNDTSNTLMSYTRIGGPSSDFAPYDKAALLFLYGDDGLGGALGQGGAGDYLMGTALADWLTGGQGNDFFDGGSGIDSACFSRTRADHQLQRSGSGTLTVQALSGIDGSDTLVNVERLAFSDQSLAFDLDGHAGITARCLGAVFGPASVANKAYVGIGLALLDGGTTSAGLMQLALDARLGVGFSYDTLVVLLYANLVGAQPSASDLAFWVDTLSSGQFTPVTLAQAVAELDLNAQNIDLVGLMANGLAFS